MDQKNKLKTQIIILFYFCSWTCNK